MLLSNMSYSWAPSLLPTSIMTCIICFSRFMKKGIIRIFKALFGFCSCGPNYTLETLTHPTFEPIFFLQVLGSWRSTCRLPQLKIWRPWLLSKSFSTSTNYYKLLPSLGKGGRFRMDFQHCSIQQPRTPTTTWSPTGAELLLQGTSLVESKRPWDTTSSRQNSSTPTS